MGKQQKSFFSYLLGLAVLILGIGLLIVLMLVYSARITEIISDPGKFRHLLVSYGSLSILIYIGVHILSVILVPVPGELVIIAGGYIYGTVYGTMYSLIGTILGSIMVFSFSRYFGYSLVKWLVPPKKFARFSAMLNRRRSEQTVFFLYLMPQMPKGILTYIAGLTPIALVKFMVLSTIARMPCIIGASYIGANLREKDFLPVILILAATGIVLLISFLMREKISHYLSGVKNLPQSVQSRLKSCKHNSGTDKKL
jgi:Uncharacterized conserved protein